MYKGIIICYSEEKKFGFIASGPREIFFHISNFQKGFRPILRDIVTFNLAPGYRNQREQAVDVRPINNVMPEPVSPATIAGLKDAFQGGMKK